jgi:hypothetical protein
MSGDCAHRVLTSRGSLVHVYGGMSLISNSMSDVWVFDTTAGRWSAINTTDTFTVAASCHTMVRTPVSGSGDDHLFVFGGLGVGSMFSSCVRCSGLMSIGTGGSFSMRPGCEPGRFSTSYGEESCTPCHFGFYASFPGQTTCTACPGDASTATEGSTTLEQCMVCAPGTCTHGTCAIVDCTLGALSAKYALMICKQCWRAAASARVILGTRQAINVW